ncbi:hypothetical protein ACFIJ5_04330 [Haloimpatiens sp. FM7330]|uniref:hypothetical protein n=1 Tax=Haloimpatiens sp. FM7330 TaxID=3298610 RepID=UPI003627AB57
MKIEFLGPNGEYKEIMDILNENHPDYDIKILSNYNVSNKFNNELVAKIGDKYYHAPTSKELYDKITDHFFRLPNCFIG